MKGRQHASEQKSESIISAHAGYPEKRVELIELHGPVVRTIGDGERSRLIHNYAYCVWELAG